jgi:hypothetical protein
MSSWARKTFLLQWPRKLTALIAAVIIWVLVNHSITITRTIPNVAIRVLNVPPGKTIEGLLPNGLLAKQLTVTLTGQRTTLSGLAAGDLEIVADAAGKQEQWSTLITKKNLVSLNPDLDLLHGISSMQPVELTVALSPLESAQIPVTILPPVGEPPKGFTFLDLWPQCFEQKVIGPKHRVDELKKKGLKLRFDLSRISKEELEQLHARADQPPESEIQFVVPESWKQVMIPFEHDKQVPLNDARAQLLQLNFLKQEFVPLGRALPLSVFYPLQSGTELNPETHPLCPNTAVREENGLFALTIPLFARNVSRLFLDVVREHLDLTIVAAPEGGLRWSIQFIDPRSLEEAYLRAADPVASSDQPSASASHLRQRFRNYVREFELYTAPNHPLRLAISLDEDCITISQI